MEKRQKSFKAPKKDQEFDHKLLDLARVVRVVKGGRRFRFRAAVVVGNRHGKVGIGVAKAQDVTLAVEKAVSNAQKHLISVSLLQGSIAHEVMAKYNTAKVLIKPGSASRGLIAGGAVRVVCDMVGIENAVGKIIGRTRNKINNAKAAIEALKQLKKHAIISSQTKT